MDYISNGEWIRKFPANGGYEEGVELLKMLANHHSTVKFISGKVVVRFVNLTAKIETEN